MVTERIMTEEEFLEMMKLAFDLIASYSETKEAKEVDWEAQVRQLLPEGMGSAGNYFSTFMNEEMQVVGYAWCADKENDMRLIAYIGVKKEHQRLGYGQRIMQTICNKAKEDGISLMVLGVEKNNQPALQLYLREGFGIEGEEDIRYVMVKNLREKK